MSQSLDVDDLLNVNGVAFITAARIVAHLEAKGITITDRENCKLDPRWIAAMEYIRETDSAKTERMRQRFGLPK